MKTSFPVLIVVLAMQWLSSADSFGQIRGARDYTKRLNAPPATTPAPAPAPSAPAKPYRTPLPAVDPVKAQAEKDAQLQRTIEFQKKRAEDGSPTAQYDLGLRYLSGDGVEKDIDLANKWLKAAAKNGNKDAEKKLAELKLGAADAAQAEPKSDSDAKGLTDPKAPADPKALSNQTPPGNPNPAEPPKSK
jgi:TPR repeat protein